MFYRRKFPLTTNRHIFSPERTPSPEVYKLTNRQFFEFENVNVNVDSEQDNSRAILPVSHPYVNEAGDNNLGCVSAEPGVTPEQA
jgi:hypothetical protein